MILRLVFKIRHIMRKEFSLIGFSSLFGGPLQRGSGTFLVANETGGEIRSSFFVLVGRKERPEHKHELGTILKIEGPISYRGRSLDLTSFGGWHSFRSCI